MNDPDYFEEMLATYPAEKRELARIVYARFAEGDSTQFFAQLLLVLDVHARYLSQVPQKMVAANADTLATIQETREEVALLAKTIETRDVNITNHAEKINELCRITQAKCDETLVAVDLIVKNLATQVDTKAIVSQIQTSVQTDINLAIIQPFMRQTERLAQTATPALREVQESIEMAKSLWEKRIWQTAWTSTLLFTFTMFGLVTMGIYDRFHDYAQRQAAQRIAEVSQVMNINGDAFRQLAIARIALKVERTQSDGILNSQGFALVVPDADGAEMRQQDGHNNGCVFITSRVKEEQIQSLQALMATNSNGAK